jgi:acetyl-CoA C-acetyltransferase
LDVDDVRWLDFYSCFPCVVEMACDALGVGLDDSRGLTVTGGLPYFGGPGNAYTLFAIATMADLLRTGGSSGGGGSSGSGSSGSGSGASGSAGSSAAGFEAGLVSGLGWYGTKHSVGVYASAPNKNGWSRGDTEREQLEIDQSALTTTVEVPHPGMSATVAASTVHYDSAGQVTGAPVLATLDDGRRVAAGPADSVKLSDLEEVSLVGERVHVAGSPPWYQPL